MADDTFASLRLEPATTVDRVADELRRAFFEGELDPGTALREVALADSLHVSRSTIREALGVLVSEGLVDRVPHKGTVVRALDADAIRDVCRARRVVESAGVASWDSATDDAKEAVRAALAEFTRLASTGATSVELTAAHLAIHRGLAALTGSERLLAMADSLYSEVRLALASVDRARRNATEQVHTHSTLVDLLERGDVPAALADLDVHLQGAERSMLDTLTPAAEPGH